jgi:ELWxxDGT repeat protein
MSLTWYNGALYFSGYDAVHGRELWKWDGTEATIVADINQGLDGSHPEYSSNPGYLTVYDGHLYFAAADGLGLNNSNLYESDGTTVTELHNSAYLNVDHGGSLPNYETVNSLVVYNDILYFSETNGVYGWGLYSYDGSNFALHGGDYGVPGVVMADDPFFTIFDGDLYFAGAWNYHDSNSDYYDLWKFDGSDFTAFGNGLNDSPENPSYVQNITVYNDALYFRASDHGGENSHGFEIWKCTSSGVVSRLADLNTGDPVGSNPGYSSEPHDFTVYNGNLYFIANNGISSPYPLYQYNDSSDTLTEVSGTPTTPSIGTYTGWPFTVYQGNMLCDTGAHALYMYDGAHWFKIATNMSMDGWYYRPDYYAVINDVYYFSGSNGGLWQWSAI